MKKFRKWLIDRFLPRWAYESLLEELAAANKKQEELRQTVERQQLLRLSGIVWTMARTRRKQKAESISPLMNVIRPPWRTSSFWQRPAMPL